MAMSFAKSLLAYAVALAVGGTLQAQNDTFAEGVRLLRLGKNQEALDKFREVLGKNPSNEEALELYRKTDQQIWYMLLTEKGEIQQIAASIMERANVEQHHGDLGRLRRLQRGGAVGTLDGGQTLVAQGEGQLFAHRALVVDDQDHGHAFLHAAMLPRARRKPGARGDHGMAEQDRPGRPAAQHLGPRVCSYQRLARMPGACNP